MNFDIGKEKLSPFEGRQLNPLVLAFIGDAVYELFIRTFLVENNKEFSANKLHLKTIEYVKAHSQSEFMKKILDNLNEEELTIYKRGRNAKSPSVPKNADVQEYRTATGLEALIGYLYLTENRDRLQYIINTIIDMS